jgi:phage host-nuclease inhibitor protein Gam
MKKIILTIAVASLSFASAGLLEDVNKLDVKKSCDVKANGLDKVIAVAEKYNPEAVKLGVEFKRLGIKNREYIKYTKEAIKAKKKETVIKYKNKGKEKTKKFPTNYAAWRACTFAVRALQLHNESQKTWRLAVPGDGYKY